MEEKESLSSLTSLRFFAALGVLLGHYHGILSFPNLVSPLLIFGGVGVCFFFILSGFVLTWNYHSDFAMGMVNTNKIKEFYWRRIARLYPVYLICLMALTVFYFIFNFDLSLAPKPHDQTHLIFSWIINLFALQAWIPSHAYQDYWNAPGWSVSVEFFFYAICPYLIYRFSRFNNPLLLALVILCAGFFFLLTLSFLVYSYGDPTSIFQIGYLYRFPFTGCWLFMFGIALGLAFIKKHELGNITSTKIFDHLKLSAVIIALLALPYFLLNLKRDEDIYPIWFFNNFNFYAFIPLFGALIWLLAEKRNFLAPLLNNKILILLGESSYCIYILHWIPMLIFAKLGVSSQNQFIWMTLSILGTIVFSIFLQLYLETPVRKFLTKEYS